MKQFLEYWPVLALLLQGLAVWAVWSMRQLAKKEVTQLVTASEAKLNAKIDKAADRIDAHDLRIGLVEGRLDEVEDDIVALPTKADFARLEGEVKGIGREVSAANNGITRLENYFLERGVERS